MPGNITSPSLRRQVSYHFCLPTN